MRQITVSDLMNPRILVVRDTMTVRELACFLMDNEITGAPVEAHDGKLVGVVSVVDVTRAVAEDAAEDAAGTAEDAAGTAEDAAETAEDAAETAEDATGTAVRDAEPAPGDDREVLVADVMSSGVSSVSEDATVSEIASAMLDSHLHRLLVTRNGEPIGIITTSDLLGLFVDDED